MRKKKILVVDDSEIYREMARYMLEARGYEVVVLASPFGFGAAISQERPDLALIDASMPALQGDQLVRIARQNNLCDFPIVLHSDRPPLELTTMVRQCGASGFIQKTPDADKLAHDVENFLNPAPPPSTRWPESQRWSSPPPAMENAPRSLRELADSLPRMRDAMDSSPRSVRDPSEMPPRSVRDASEMPPRSVRDPSEMPPRSVRAPFSAPASSGDGAKSRRRGDG